MAENDFNNINPQIMDVTIGVRTLRKIKIYPLSAHDEFEVTKLFAETVATFFTGRKSDVTNFEFIKFLIGLVKDNISSVLSLVSDEKGTDILKELTNLQVVEIAKIIVSVNYEEPLKNAQSLLETLKQYLSGRQPLMSVNDMVDTGLKTSFTKDSEAGD